MAEKILVPTNMRPADEVAANARLIAAAPELLEALEQAAIELEEASAILHGEGLTSTASLFTSAIARHRAAIAKAKGEG